MAKIEEPRRPWSLILGFNVSKIKSVNKGNNILVSIVVNLCLLLVLVALACSGENIPVIKFDHLLEIYRQKELHPNYVLVAAHRGDWRNAPENSLEGMQLCIDKGVDIVETDVMMTKDSILILMHDQTLDRTTTGIGYVRDWTLDSIRTLYLRNGYGEPTPYKIPTLAQALNLAKGKVLVDLDKSYALLPLAYKVAKKTQTLNQVIFRVDDDWETFYSKHKSSIPEIMYMPLVRSSTNDPEKFIADFVQAPYPPTVIEVIYKKEDNPQLEALEKFSNINPRIMMNSVFSRVCAGHNDWEALNDPDENWGWLIGKGASVIGTDRPAALLDYLEEKNLRRY